MEELDGEVEIIVGKEVLKEELATMREKRVISGPVGGVEGREGKKEEGDVGSVADNRMDCDCAAAAAAATDVEGGGRVKGSSTEECGAGVVSHHFLLANYSTLTIARALKADRNLSFVIQNNYLALAQKLGLSTQVGDKLFSYNIRLTGGHIKVDLALQKLIQEWREKGGPEIGELVRALESVGAAYGAEMLREDMIRDAKCKSASSEIGTKIEFFYPTNPTLSQQAVIKADVNRLCKDLRLGAEWIFMIFSKRRTRQVGSRQGEVDRHPEAVSGTG